MLQLRLIIPNHCTEPVLSLLASDDTVISASFHPGAAVKPAGADLVVCDVLREHASTLIERLEAIGVASAGEISVLEIEATRSEPAHQVRKRMPGRGSDVVVWETLEDQIHQDSVPSIAFFCFMAAAAVIATVGIVLDSAVVIVGAMVVGPEYGPLAAAALGLYHGRWAVARSALWVVISGLVLVVFVALLAAFFFDAIQSHIVAAEGRFFTRFVVDPNIYSAVVAFVAGLVGVMAIGLGRSGALTGVVVSATTLPAAAGIGVNAAFAEWDDVGRGAIQLAINVVCLLAGSLAALVGYRFVRREIDEHPPARA